MKFLIDHIAPESDPPAGFLFYFYHHADDQGAIISRIALRIEKMEIEMKHQLERTLDLQLLTAPRDASGNVCFADAPDLRPEFRTTFGPFDLWDYYYALFHRASWWESRTITDRELPFPSADHFWHISRQGKKLRRIHSSKIRTEKYQFELQINSHDQIKEMPDRYLSNPGQTDTGRLYLNDRDYIGQVPRSAWDFQLARRSFLADELAQRTGQVPGPEDIRSILEWIVLVDRTSKFSVIS